MAAVDPYSSCPCGSGKKFKWCCHKVEAQADRVRRLLESGQLDTALKICDEGLKLDPQNPLLTIRKAMILAHRKETDSAFQVIEELLAAHPGHPAALEFQLRLAILANNPLLAVVLLQEAMSTLAPDQWRILAPPTEVLATQLIRAGRIPSGIEHLALAVALDPQGNESIESGLRAMQSNPGISPWLRNHYTLAQTPTGLTPAQSEQFSEATLWAEHGLWSAAAASFEALASESIPKADLNLGLCRLWLGDHDGAVNALRHYVATVSVTPETVDLEALCQLIAPIEEQNRVELLQWIWPIRDRAKLQAWLSTERQLHLQGTEPANPADPDSPPIQVYLLLAKPIPALESVQGPEDLPIVQGRLLVGQEIVIIEAFDDGRLDRLSEWFRDRAGPAIPPAHPRTKRVGRESRVALALQIERLFPDKAPPAMVREITQLERKNVVEGIWPTLPLPALSGKSPRQAANDPSRSLQLRVAFRLIEQSSQLGKETLDFASLRASLSVPPEPVIDPETDLETVHLSRLPQIAADQLDDQHLLQLFTISHKFQIAESLENSAHELLKRTELLEREVPGVRFTVFADLVNLALAQGQPEAVLSLIERGRNEEPASHRSANAVNWDILELRNRSVTQTPEEWVPFMATILDRYRDNRDASSTLLTVLIQMRLVQAVPSPEKPGEMYLDTRNLQAVIARYGPRITTATGELGVSATKGPLWTPESEAGKSQGGGIWTPGSAKPQPAPGEKPRIIVPGR